MSSEPLPSDIKTPKGVIYIKAFESGDVLLSYYRNAPIARAFKSLMVGRARYHGEYSSDTIAKWIIPERYADDIVGELSKI